MRRNTLISMIFSTILVLALTIAPAAMAHHKDSHEGGPKKTGEQTEDTADTGADGSQGAEDSDDEKSNNGNANGHDKDKSNNGNANGHDKDKGNNGKKNDGVDDKGKDGDEPYTDGAPGNNGTIKIDGEPYDTSKGQEAHVGCEFRVLYWGFDEGDDLQSVLTFTAHAPTKGDFVFTDTITLGAGEPDIAGPYNLVDELVAAGIEPHPKQGWHIRLTTNTEYSQGADTKHKVFWIQCDEPDVAPVVDEDTDEDTKSGGYDASNDKGGTSVLGSTETAEDDSAPAERGAEVSAGGANAETAAGVLPFTGMQLMTFLAIAAGLIAAGILFTRLRRN
jgi:hypothetical protein